MPRYDYETLNDLTDLMKRLEGYTASMFSTQYHKEPNLYANKSDAYNKDIYGVHIYSNYSVTNAHYTVNVEFFIRTFDDKGKCISTKSTFSKFYKFRKGNYEKYYQLMIDMFAPDYHPHKR